MCWHAMVSQRAKVSIIGQAVGLIVGTAFFMVAFGLDIVAGGLSGLLFLLAGGWIAEKYLAEEDIESRATGG